MDWKQAQSWEENWHLNNPFIYREQLKQEVYAEKMGLTKDYPDYNLGGIQVLDIGGGDYSMLLKYKNFKGVVIDPLMDKFPKWVKARYKESGIEPINGRGEELDLEGFDEVWEYNVLQHTENPEMIIKNAKKAGNIVRLFEWIETGLSEGHIHNLHEKELNKWLGGYGKVEKLNDRGCVGLAYFGVFI